MGPTLHPTPSTEPDIPLKILNDGRHSSMDQTIPVREGPERLPVIPNDAPAAVFPVGPSQGKPQVTVSVFQSCAYRLHVPVLIECTEGLSIVAIYPLGVTAKPQ